MDILFSSDSIFVHNQEKDLALIEDSEPEIAQAVRSLFSSLLPHTLRRLTPSFLSLLPFR